MTKISITSERWTRHLVKTLLDLNAEIEDTLNGCLNDLENNKDSDVLADKLENKIISLACVLLEYIGYDVKIDTDLNITAKYPE